MRKRIMRGAVLFAAAAALLMGALGAFSAYRLAEEQVAERLWGELTLVGSLDRPGESDDAWLNALKAIRVGDRLTWIAADGAVLYDTQSDAAKMENHGERQEVAQALQSGQGTAKRYSATLLEEQRYCALRLPDGSVLRAAATQRSLMGVMSRLLWASALGAAAICGLAAALSRGWTRRLVRPINEIDLEHPLASRGYDELSPMLRRMEEQNRRLDAQWKALEARQNELNAILSHMEEGLVFLDGENRVLMMNQSARSILHTDKAVDGKTPLMLYNRSQTLTRTAESATAGEPARATLAALGRDYLLTVSNVKDTGCKVLLLQDVTEQNAAEESRKRFSANVSHELRTPLTTISGYAELMQNGMIQPQDVPLFARKIYEESRRLLQLIEDIMHLSKLDEGAPPGRREPVELYGAARKAAEENAELAKERNVTVTVAGEEVSVPGEPALMDEMLRNLIENGIKYNRPEGRVTVTVTDQGGKAQIIVEDTGIGIPPEHVNRVFERFYRVDKSRSKQTGGTGLGLSIVKHGAEYHNAELSLTSAEGVGTKVTLAFRKELSRA